ncbi:MAG: YraN family protein [Lachnospiraceae bacterium]
MKKNMRKTGTEQEKKAAEYLQQQGYRILEQNYRCRQGEIDLIAKDGEYLVFVEVKYRTQDSCGEPAEAVTAYKQRKISRTALFYCMKHSLPEDTPCRFDVVSILGDQIELIQNAFLFQQ